MAELTDALARRAVERSVGDRHAEYVREMQRVVEATYRLIERTGDVDPSLRAILEEARLSTQAFYRYFRSKDELLVLLLDDGRRRLLDHLDRRVTRASTPEGRVRAWIEGVLAQAASPQAARRTRPFVVHQDRLAESFPDEQQASVDLLVDQVAEVLAGLPGSGPARSAATRRDAGAVYHLAFGALHTHLTRGTRPGPAEVDHLAHFCIRGTGSGAHTDKGTRS